MSLLPPGFEKAVGPDVGAGKKPYTPYTAIQSPAWPSMWVCICHIHHVIGTYTYTRHIASHTFSHLASEVQ